MNVRIAHVDMLVSDMARSIEFYVGVLGCKVVDDGVAEMASFPHYTGSKVGRVRIVLLQLPGARADSTMLELMQFQDTEAEVPIRLGSKERPLPSLWTFSLLVDELEPFLAKLAERGVVPETPIDVVKMPRAGTCRITFVRDPDGNLIELIDVPKRRP